MSTPIIHSAIVCVNCRFQFRDFSFFTCKLRKPLSLLGQTPKICKFRTLSSVKEDLINSDEDGSLKKACSMGRLSMRLPSSKSLFVKAFGIEIESRTPLYRA